MNNKKTEIVITIEEISKKAKILVYKLKDACDNKNTYSMFIETASMVELVKLIAKIKIKKEDTIHNEKIDIKCPNCKKTVKPEINDVIETKISEMLYHCPLCNTDLTVYYKECLE